MLKNETLRAFVCALGPLLLSACGHSPLAPVAAHRVPTTLGTQNARPLGTSNFTDVSLAELAAHGDDGTYDGQLVRIEASFERFTFAREYGRTYEGYKLWDRAGHWLLCQNIYAVTSVYPTATPDRSRDLSHEASVHLLGYGTYARLECMFHRRTSGASHGGVFQVPASLDVYTIDGQPTHELVNS
jgi:hypothetical protein